MGDRPQSPDCKQERGLPASIIAVSNVDMKETRLNPIKNALNTFTKAAICRRVADNDIDREWCIGQVMHLVRDASECVITV